MPTVRQMLAISVVGSTAPVVCAVTSCKGQKPSELERYDETEVLWEWFHWWASQGIAGTWR